MFAGVAGAALVITGAIAGPVTAGAVTPTAPTAKPAIVQSPITFEPGRYIVVLADEAAATYEGGVSGLARTAPRGNERLDVRRSPVADYREYLRERQNAVAAEVGASVDESYTVTVNGFAAELSVEQAAELAASRDVVALIPDELQQIQAETGTEFLGLDGPGGVWEAIGGAESAGEGVVIGVLDTGIAPEHPSFAGEPLGTTPGNAPYRDGDRVVFEKSDGGVFSGVCETGVQFTVDDCSTKIIGARYFVNGFGENRIGDENTGPGEFLSPRDGDGHGSHTAGTAAGNHRVDADVASIDFGPISGVAPAAKIASYKVCWNGPDPTTNTDDGCATSDLLAGIDTAVADGVDVINYSIGGGAATSTVTVIDQAFYGAAVAGVFVSASAGNSGPGFSTLGNAAPWITTVAASTIPSYEATATLGNGEAFAGASITVDMSEGAEPLEGPLVLSTELGDTSAASAEDIALCAPGSLDPELVEADMIVVCDRGVYDRVAKSAEVQRVGGAGMLHVNVAPGSVDADAHSVPTIHLDAQYRDAVRAYAATDGATVSFAAGNSTDVVTPVPQVAGFSSRGPVLADGSDILKPDISAPGVGLLAATSNREGETPTYGFLSGTSMSAPHIAGLALLYLGERPTASPSEVKSAIMTTAYDTRAADGSAVTNPFIQGAGHADPTRFFEPGLLYLNGPADWDAYIQGIGYDIGVEPIAASNLNLASIAAGAVTGSKTVTRTVTSTQAGEFTSSIQGLAGIDVQVSPSTLSFGAAGEMATFEVTFTRTTATLDTYATGSLTWTSGDTTVRSPIAVQPVTIIAPANAEGEGVDGSVEIAVTPGGTGDIALASTGLSLGERLADPADPESANSGSGATGDFEAYTVTVPEGSQFTRFDLEALDPESDLDLIVYRLNAAGTPVAGWISATATASERIDLVDPVPGTYLIYADVWFAPSVASWNLTVTSVTSGGSDLVLDPAVLAGEQGVETTFQASWSGLEPEASYLGIIEYGDTGASTILTVATGKAPVTGPVAVAPPVIEGTAVEGQTVSATTGEWEGEKLTFTYQWLRDGKPVPGKPGTRPELKLKKPDVGRTLTVVVTATDAAGESVSQTSDGVVVEPKQKGGPKKPPGPKKPKGADEVI
ncbi:peptidase inhibitor I9 [Microcella alkaliphila]|uniref:Peptidase inhibitor I9 n=1 Tax=Microcella alkaliphila TaxID=279828 RepID=A0A4Q7TFY6_9MICO|nr:S8 family peptidase [Microcella alkaliphila]RZT58328.1 peptidase inhibitor I9 [Microcella alkaliphila]